MTTPLRTQLGRKAQDQLAAVAASLVNGTELPKSAYDLAGDLLTVGDLYRHVTKILAEAIEEASNGRLTARPFDPSMREVGLGGGGYSFAVLDATGAPAIVTDSNSCHAMYFMDINSGGIEQLDV